MLDTVKPRSRTDEQEKLESEFRRFSDRAASLQQTYLRLRREVQQANLQLEETNRRLKKKVRQLHEANAFQQSILGSIPVGVIVTDLEGLIKTFNPAAQSIWGMSRDEALGQPCRAILGEHGDFLRDVLANRTSRHSVRRSLPDRNRVVSSSACLVRDTEGQPLGAIQVDRDVSRLEELQQQVQHKEQLAELGESAAGLAHEVRKPLNGIKGFASLLQRRADEEEPVDVYSSRIVEAAERLDGLLESLLDFASPEDVETRKVDLGEKVERVMEFARAGDKRNTRNVDLDVRISRGARFVDADPAKLEQVLLNLVKNALEAIEGAGRVSVRASRDGNTVTIEIVDTGCGMSDGEQQRIFEPFHTGKESGTGLGLPVVKKLLMLHGSRLHVESEPGEGTAMRFVLNAAKNEEE